MKRVLLIEDNGSLSIELVKRIEDLGYFVERAYSYISALGIWIEDKENFDCIILDMQINPDGLSLKEIETYAPLFGMAFLYNISEGKTPEQIVDIHKKTIIYTGFEKELKSLSRTNNWDLKNIKIIPKRGFGVSELMKAIQRIL